MVMKVLVTGAAGHVATLVLAMLQTRHALRLTDLNEPHHLPSGATFRQANLLRTSKEELEQLFLQIDVVVHCAYVAFRRE